MTKKKVKKKRSAVRVVGDIVIILIILALLGAAGWMLYKEFFPNNTPILKMQVINREDNSIDWAALREVNPETVGWLSIEGTNIDTPVVQTTDNDKYLYTSFNGESDERGVPFLDMNYKWQPRSQNSLIYGHSTMRSGVHVMFDDLLYYYKDPNFITEHNKIVYRRPPELGGDGVWEIFAVLVVEQDYDYRQLEFADDESFLAYYQNIKNQSIAATDVNVQPGDEILTLSTCIFNVGLNDGRLAVIARRVS